MEGYRKFCNKVFNATKFAMLKLDREFVPSADSKVLIRHNVFLHSDSSLALREREPRRKVDPGQAEHGG